MDLIDYEVSAPATIVGHPFNPVLIEGGGVCTIGLLFKYIKTPTSHFAKPRSFELGCRLIGVTDLCTFPAEATDKPKVSRTTIDTSVLSMEEVEAQMQRCKAEGRPPFVLDEESLARHQPGLILTQDMCQTCDPSSSQAYQVPPLHQDYPLDFALGSHNNARMFHWVKTEFSS